MHFPLQFRLGPLLINSHVLFEALAYFVAFRFYLYKKRRMGDFLRASDRLSIVVAAILGAAVGSKLLAWAENPALTLQQLHDPLSLMGGKTIVGGLLGGTLAVEWVKQRLGITSRTGDLFALPLIVGIAIGRIGCFFAGLADQTYGSPTSLPWGVDFGDGIRRHPTQLYEVIALAMLYLAIHVYARRPHRTGDLFRLFLTGYLAWRLAIDFFKPEPRFAGLTAIQWTCCAALLFYWRDIAYILNYGAKPWANESAPTSSTT